MCVFHHVLLRIPEFDALTQQQHAARPRTRLGGWPSRNQPGRGITSLFMSISTQFYPSTARRAVGAAATHAKLGILRCYAHDTRHTDTAQPDTKGRRTLQHGSGYEARKKTAASKQDIFYSSISTVYYVTTSHSSVFRRRTPRSQATRRSTGRPARRTNSCS